MLGILLDKFHFSSLWNGGIMLFSCFAIVIYFFILPTEKGHSIWKKAAFVVGMVAMFLAIGSPLNIIARIVFRAHIIQIFVLFFMAAPLLVYGAKWRIFSNLGSKFLWLKPNATILIAVFVLLLYLYHVPFIFDFARMDMFLNYFYLLILFLAAIFMWVPIIHGKFSVKKKRLMLCMIVFFTFPLAIWLILTNESLFRTYTDMSYFTQSLELCLPAGETLPPDYIAQLLPFSPVLEQHVGGWIWLVCSVLIGIVAVIFMRNKSVR